MIKVLKDVDAQIVAGGVKHSCLCYTQNAALVRLDTPSSMGIRVETAAECAAFCCRDTGALAWAWEGPAVNCADRAW